METETFDSALIMDRLQRLEKQNRRLKIIGLLVLLLIGSFAAIAAKSTTPVPPVLQAERFVLIDSTGKQTAWLGVDDKNRPGLSIRDTTGERAWIGLWGEKGIESGVGFFVQNGKERVWMGLASGTNPRLVLYDSDRKQTWSTP